MTASITITNTIEGSNRIINCTVNSGADIPNDIFLYENNNGVPGKFFAVCSLSDYNRFQTYVGSSIPVFGNKYIKQAFGQQTLSINDDYSSVVSSFVSNCQDFRTAYLTSTAPTSHIYTL